MDMKKKVSLISVKNVMSFLFNN